jgi:hypothetical protein
MRETLVTGRSAGGILGGVGVVEDGFPVPPSHRDVPLDRKVPCMLPRLRHVVSELHAQ